MGDVQSLVPQNLKNRCDSTLFTFENTDDIKETVEFIGQKRAHDAILFGININCDGYNLYALGPESIGKQSIIYSILKEEAIKKETPSDWCYVYNFKRPRYPLALQLPPGLGISLKMDMENLIDDLRTSLPAIFETIEYQARIKQIHEELNLKQKKYFDELQAEVEEQEMTIVSTAKGFVVVPIRGGKILTTKDLLNLTKEDREHTEDVRNELNEHLSRVVDKVQKLHEERRKQEKENERVFTLNVVQQFVNKIKEHYKILPDVLTYLDTVQEDIIGNVKLFTKNEEHVLPSMWGESHPSEFEFSRYQVNVIVDNANIEGAPIIFEDDPRDYKLFGRIEHVSQFGASLTDFSLIRPGALHRANGGYLIIEAHKMVEQTWAWEALKNALISKQIRIELPPHQISITSASTLEPESIPLNIKIILLGNREDYYHLRDCDALFDELFNVAVDFEETILRTDDTLQEYAKLIATHAKQKHLRPLDVGAVARVVDHSSRLIEDKEHISLNMNHLINLLEESDYWAQTLRHTFITASDVQHAIDAQIFRLDHHQRLLYEDIQRDIILINTEGEKVGQINALTTFRFGEFTFGFPSRVTATARIGREGIIDIEREVNLSGPIHTKGILILSGFLKGRYIPKYPLNLSASIVFEQSYGTVDGDSASVAELCALLSALTFLPIKQTLAVTGSVNQHGFVQPIGNVNEKIEGFFAICQARGLTGNQGVLIPKTNIKNLMLNDNVIAAAKEKKFHIYAIETIDEAISLLFGRPAGERVNDHYPEDSVNGRVEQRLKEFAKIYKKWTHGLL